MEQQVSKHLLMVRVDVQPRTMQRGCAATLVLFTSWRELQLHMSRLRLHLKARTARTPSQGQTGSGKEEMLNKFGKTPIAGALLVPAEHAFSIAAKARRGPHLRHAEHSCAPRVYCRSHGCLHLIHGNLAFLLHPQQPR